MPAAQIITVVVALIIKTAVLAARWPQAAATEPSQHCPAKRGGVKHRFGAVGRHGSIAVTERVIRTMKDEWLRRVGLIRGFDHLAALCQRFCCWYNDWRPHATLEGHRPADVYCRDLPESIRRDAKVVPLNIERRLFDGAGVTGFRLRAAA